MATAQRIDTKRFTADNVAQFWECDKDVRIRSEMTPPHTSTLLKYNIRMLPNFFLVLQNQAQVKAIMPHCQNIETIGLMRLPDATSYTDEVLSSPIRSYDYYWNLRLHTNPCAVDYTILELIFIF